MLKQLLKKMKRLMEQFFITGLISTLLLINTHEVLHARGGGRMGGGSFSAPSRSYSAPSRSSGSNSGGYVYGYSYSNSDSSISDEGSGFSNLIIFIILVITIGDWMRRFQQNANSFSPQNEFKSNTLYKVKPDNPPVSIDKIQVGVLNSKHELQQQLNKLALFADTGTSEGRASLLQKVTLALLCHTRWWIYGFTEYRVVFLSAAEKQFNQLVLGERSKFTAETLSNVNNQIHQTSTLASNPIKVLTPTNNEQKNYLVVTLVVSTLGRLTLPVVNDSQSLRSALQQIGDLNSDNLLALEILWTPQEEGEILTSDEMLADYPNLKLL